MKTEKKKPTYSLYSNLKYVLGNMWKWQKDMTVYAFLRSPFTVAVAFLGIYLSREVVNAVTQRKSPGDVLLLIAAITLGLIISLVAEKFLNAKLEQLMLIQDFRYQVLTMDKCAESDYENMESAAGQTRISKALENAGTDQSGARLIAKAFSSLAANILGILSYAAILFQLSPWILLAITVTTLSGFPILKITAAWSYRNKDRWKTYDRKLDYLRNNSGDFTRAKDLRLYGMTDWFRQVFAGTLGQRMNWQQKEQKLGLAADGLRALLSLLREGIAYGFLVYLVFHRHLPVADFVLYFGVIGGFTTWLNGLVSDFDSINRFHLSFSEMREYLDYPDKTNQGTGVPLPEGELWVEFRKVSFRYPGSSEDTLKDLSFTLARGEKLAIVGLNGAGKSTLVKLMCGLYDPTGGEILLNGHPVNAYNRKEYFSLFSVVFQDIFVMPLSVARNVSATTEEETDRERVREALTLAGLAPKIGKLAEGMDTRLIKSVYDDAVDLSGGELQKLALARALYKNGRALILDEPTAALDPIAENEIYMEYNRMTLGHTAVFISHRLASTRFCDRIFLLEQGRIMECGNHEELMQHGGRYYEMYQVQSHYYREGVAEHAVNA
ncbi:ABC transporter ATP-binding protein [Paenibacillus sp. NFR01]|uniref:ABC transporter ATP-binding protein n=1 Tax=Paenibacillus sp. NFR01 TaxID=1566279 RepID=UPI0008AC5B57|nr:ABC transporter ATP-binding protein [Paenibacillus sp. NFR01]SET09980.1 ATP-binding cassette, subfamily B [Paenibacillus sp. NFR01]